VQDKLPAHLRKTFQQIRSFENYDFSSYSAKAHSNSSQPIWRNETAARAQRIAITANTTILEGQVSEIEWRLRLEELVLARFRLDNDWYGHYSFISICTDEFSQTCGKRLWRSEVEAIIERPGPISASLADRRNHRRPCECQSERRYLDL
jgi:hypothetical protein